jgi:hypothetical protein
MSSSPVSRRQILVGGALGAVAAFAPGLAAAPSPIARAWAKAEALRLKLAPHGQAIEAAFRSGGVPGWMRLKGEAHALGETRYGLLVEILNATPTGRGDLAIQRRVAQDGEMVHGPRDWAEARVTLAERGLSRAA